jgi:hypothetical protein
MISCYNYFASILQYQKSISVTTMYLFICIFVSETYIALELLHALHPWLRSMKDQWNVYKLHPIITHALLNGSVANEAVTQINYILTINIRT